MKNITKKAVARTKRFVANHKVGLAFATGASIGIVLNKFALKAHDDFLTEHGLYDEFYKMTEENV